MELNSIYIYFFSFHSKSIAQKERLSQIDLMRSKLFKFILLSKKRKRAPSKILYFDDANKGLKAIANQTTLLLQELRFMIIVNKRQASFNNYSLISFTCITFNSYTNFPT